MMPMYCICTAIQRKHISEDFGSQRPLAENTLTTQNVQTIAAADLWLYDFDIWSTTLTFELDLNRVNVNKNAQLSVLFKNTHTHTHTRLIALPDHKSGWQLAETTLKVMHILTMVLHARSYVISYNKAGVEILPSL